MIQFADDTLLYLFVGGCDQAILAAVMAGTILPLVAWFTCWSYPRVANRFFLFNLSLLGWSIPGNFVWLRLTESRFWVQDDNQVWAPFHPPTPWVFNHAGGGQEFWGSDGGTTFPQLYFL